MKMGTSQQFSLRWNNYGQHITCAFDNLRSEEDLVDVTLSCEGRKIHAHKMLLSACSTYFKDVFKENPCKHPVIIFRNVKFEDLVAIVDFMYQGEVNVEQEQLSSFLTTAEMLAVQGLTDGTGPHSSKENSKDETLNRRRPPSLLESSLLGSSHDLANNRQQQPTPQSSPVNHQPRYPSKPSTPATPRSDTPPSYKKRKISHPPVKTNSMSGASLIIPKTEMSDEGESDPPSISEPDIADVVLTDSRESPQLQHTTLKSEALEVSSLEMDCSTISATDSAIPKPGTSGCTSDSMQESRMVEEYLEESTDEENDVEIEIDHDNETETNDNVNENVEIEIESVQFEDECIQYENECILYENEDVQNLNSKEEDEDDEEGTYEYHLEGTLVNIEEDEEIEDKKSEIGSELEIYEAMCIEIDDSVEAQSVHDEEILVEETEPQEVPDSVEYIYAEGVSDNNEIIIGSVPKFQCKVCATTFKRLDSLYKHHSVHKGKTVCPVCNLVFSRVSHRTRHMKAKHPDVELLTSERRIKRKRVKADDDDDAFDVLDTM